MARIAAIVKIVAVPYSVDPQALEVLRATFDVATPQLAELQDTEYTSSAWLTGNSLAHAFRDS